MSDLISQIKTFARVVEAGSFSSVAAEQNSSQPTISRQVAALEEHLGCRLFHRTTRSLSLTDDGHIFYQHALQSLESLKLAEDAVGKRKGKPSGTLRMSCAVVFGRLHIIPRLAQFMANNPNVAVDLRMNDQFSDLIEEGIDLSIRVGEVTDPNMVSRQIGTTRRIVVASKTYLAKAGTPQTPNDLRRHQCIVYSRLNAGANWRFNAPQGPINIPIQGRYTANNTEGVRTAIIQGLGIGYVPTWHFVDNELENGDLVALLQDWQPQPQPISAVYPCRHYLAPKVREMIDYLAAEFAADPMLQPAKYTTTPNHNAGVR